MAKKLRGVKTMRDTTILILAIHALLYVFVILDVPILRQCVGFIYLTFVPGFVILHALRIKTGSVAIEFSLSVSLSIAFIMFVGLLANTLYPLLGISAPLSALPSLVTVSVLTLAIFTFSQRKEIGNNSDTLLQLLHAKIDTEGAILCAVSILLLSLSIVGALYDSVFLLVSVIAGIAAIFITSIFLYKRIPSSYYTFVLFAVSLSLLLQTSLISKHIMGYDIFGEYSVFESVRAAGHWTPPGIILSTSSSADVNSILSTTILPTVYSTVLNLNGELILKIIYPFIFCFVPIFLFKTYEAQLGKIVGLLSVLFFIAEPLNFYGLESLSLAREMIFYLFLSATIFCFVKKDLDMRTRRVLVLTFSAGLAVSAYSLAFLYAFDNFRFCSYANSWQKRPADEFIACLVYRRYYVCLVHVCCYSTFNQFNEYISQYSIKLHDGIVHHSKQARSRHGGVVSNESNCEP